MKLIINFFTFIDLAFAKIVEAILIASLLFLAGITFVQVILRNFFDSGIYWGDVGSRNIVMWIAFLGAMLATRERKHISIDAMIRFLPRRAREAVRVVLDIVAAAISILLANAAYNFVSAEYQAGTILFSWIKAWHVEAIIPFGFAMIGLEYIIGVALDIRRLIVAGELSERTQRREQ